MHEGMLLHIVQVASVASSSWRMGQTSTKNQKLSPPSSKISFSRYIPLISSSFFHEKLRMCEESLKVSECLNRVPVLNLSALRHTYLDVLCSSSPSHSAPSTSNLTHVASSLHSSLHLCLYFALRLLQSKSGVHLWTLFCSVISGQDFRHELELL